MLAACGVEHTADTVYDPCAPLTISVAAELGPDEYAGVVTAIDAWALVLRTQLVVGAGPRAADVLPIRFESGDAFYRAIYWDARGEIAVGRDRLDPAEYGIAIAHELGHAFGLPHIPTAERSSVMNVGNVEITPNREDAIALEARWPSCAGL